jgi:hypothetical protein
MASYPIVWQTETRGEVPVAGRLQMSDRGVVLHGGHRGQERRIEIPAREIIGARSTPEPIGPLRAIALDSRSFATILIATVGGLALRGEILEHLQVLAAAVA